MRFLNRKHIILYSILRPLVAVYLKFRFDYRCEKAEDLPEQYIVLSNHATDYDPLLVGISFPRQMYFVASEHIARWGFLSRLIDFLVGPIMRPKGASAAAAVKEMLRRIRQGHNVAMFPEGVRTWDGCTNPISPSTGKLVKTSGIGLVTYKLTGGYFASPMWGGAGVRRGPVHGSVVNVYTKEQLAQMSAQEVYHAIVRDLQEDAYARQMAEPKAYRGRLGAARLENLLFTCPACGAHDSFHTLDDRIHCTCGHWIGYDRFGMLQNCRFQTVKELYAWQKEIVAAAAEAGECYTAPLGTLYTVAGHQTQELAVGSVSLSAQTLSCGNFRMPFDQITDLAMHGQRKLVFTADHTYYELHIAAGANALKFMLLHGAIQERKA